MLDLKINLIDMVLSFSAAMDTISQELTRHHSRVTNYALDIAKEMKLSKRECFEIMLAARIHDIGVLSSNERREITALVFDSDYAHAARGYMIIRDFKMLEPVARIILHHHRHWNNGANKLDSNDKKIPIAAWILHLADKIDIFSNSREYPLAQAKSIINKILPLEGSIFHPDVVEAFMRLSDKEYFWLDGPFSHSLSKHRDVLKNAKVMLCGSALSDLSRAFSRIIDYKSKFTSTHSAGVSSSAVMLTKLAGFSEDQQEQMQIAGYLHDLGKITVPEDILLKDGPLNENERLIMNGHTFHTYNILSRVEGLENINRWASFHHEKLDGKGYPFHKGAGELDIFSRLMTVADMFTALSEDRPYRSGVNQSNIEKLLKSQVSEGKIDKDLVELLCSHYKEMDDNRTFIQQVAKKDYESVIAVATTI